MDSTINKELLFSHFMGKSSAIQKQLIDEWAAVKANEELYYKWLEEYEVMYPEYVPDVDLAINNFRDFQKNSCTPSFQESRISRPSKARLSRRRLLFSAVAASLSLFMLFWVVKDTEFFQYTTHKTEYGQTHTYRLPDGSSVTLNANSTLKVPRWGFGKKTRKVYLVGEASFSVAHTSTHQKFVVQTPKQFEVVVLGTEFTVFSRERGSRVVLNKGKVQINLQEGSHTRQMVMKPGDLVTLDTKNRVEKKSSPQPEIHSAWQNHRYVFEQTSLQEIVYILKENYGLTVVVNEPNLLSQTVTGTLTVDRADHILELIETVLDLRVTKEQQRILIAPNNQ